MIDKTKVFIYLEEFTPRTQYIFELVFKHIYFIDFVTSNSLDELKDTELPCIQYCKSATLKKGIHISSFGLLNKSGPCDKPIIDTTAPKPKIYATLDGTFDFDLFSAIFYIVSRAEEYNPDKSKLDIHNRFKSEFSILNELDVLHIPIVNKWLESLKQKLKDHYPSINFPKKNYTFQLSCDIDMAWSYKNKGFARNAGALLRNILTGKIVAAKDQLKVLTNTAIDPFENYDLLKSLNSNHSILYFILLGKHGTYDKNISPPNIAFRNLIQSLRKDNQIGIHPSYDAGINKTEVENEIGLLKSILETEVLRSRQHYLKINWPKTYQLLLLSGIKHEYSLGFFDNIGFRTGLCLPYPWYDLEREEMTDLMIHPFQIMDVSLKNYLNLRPEEALKLSIPIIKEVKKYNGDLHLIWHNSSFNGTWNNWTACLKGMIKEARSID